MTAKNRPTPTALIRVAAATACLWLGLGTSHGQTATAPAGGTDRDERVTLTPFTVSAEKDVGFVAASSLAGGRIATALKDTPVAYSVVTAEFLEAFNLTDVAEATQWSVNSTVIDADGTNRAFGTSVGNGGLRTRGVATGLPTRNFFPFIMTADSYNLDRVDYGRGPNAVLFGAGGVGGTVNSVTKQADVSKNFQSARIQLGSYNRYRFTADANHALNRQFAVRTNVVWDQSDTWRDNEWKDRYGAHLAATYQPTSRLTLRAEAEYGRSRELRGTTSLRDRLSAWDGTTTFSNIPTTLPTNAQLAAAGIVRSGMRWVTHPGFGGRVLNFENRYVTKGAAQNTNITLTNLINGVPIRTPSFSINNQAMVDDNFGVPADRYARALAGSKYFTIPTRESTTVWSNKLPTFTEKSKDLSLVANYKVGGGLFIELAGDINEGDTNGQTGLARRGGQDIYIDIDSTLPGGGANPNFLHPFMEFMEYQNLRTNKMRSARAQAVYIKDTRFGKFQFSGMAGMTEHKTVARARTLLLPLKSRAPDARSWVDNLEYSEYAIYTRFYSDQPNRNYAPPPSTPVTLVNPVTGLTETVTPTWMFDTRREDNNRNSLREYKFLQAAGNLDLFKNRLVLIGAFRRDFATIADKRVLSPGDMPAGWDGTSLIFRQDPPKDYFDLKYTPKNAAGVAVGPAQIADVRPRANINGANLPQPQYANDRFRDDYDSPALSPIINTFTVGGVINVTRWLGIYSNVAETFNLTAPQQRVDGTLVPPTSSRGKDYGLRVTLPNGRLSLSIGHFNSFQAGTSVLSPAGFNGAYNAISDAPVVGDLSPVGRNARNVARFPQNVWSTVTSETKGYEFELTANFTRAWRMILNAGNTKALVRDQYPDIIAYFKSQDAISRQILADAGILIDANNDAFINPALNEPTKINQQRVQAAVNGWNNLIDTVIPNTTGLVPQESQGSSRWVGNLATDYRFQSGRLKGLRVGAGLNYRGGQVVGYRGSDTIVNPANPATAIDDPSVDAGTSVYAPSYYRGVASLSYSFKLKEGRSLQLDLNIDNLFNRRAPIYGSSGGVVGTSATNLRPRTDISSPARVTVPGNLSYLIPRNYTLSAKLNF
ncbi:MAG: TonB-dependent receptor plug domain-containing protein [Opitutaceae bacterium]|nr:TonB-dependent receptor plug domain-containing protein [Opitutaceae bacterium]